MGVLGMTIGKALSTAGSWGSGLGLFAGGIGGLLSLGKNLFGPSEEELMQKQHQYELEKMEVQNKYNLENAAIAQQYGKDMWDYTNFENQRKHLENAGLSVGLMYGKGGAGGATAAGATPAGVAQGNSNAVAMGLQLRSIQLQALQQSAEIAKVNAETKNIEANTEKIEEETENTKELREQIIAQTENLKENTKLTAFSNYLNELKKNSTDYKEGKDFSEYYIENIFKGLKKEGIELDTESAKLLNEKGIAERLTKDLEIITKGEIAKAAEQIEKAKQAKNNTEREKWELIQDQALSKLLDTIGSGEYAKLLSNIIKQFMKR